MRECSVSEAWKKKYPERVVVAVTRDEEKEKVNFIPLGWFMPTSFQPPLVAISVGVTRYSHRLLQKTGEFVLFFPSPEMGDRIYYWGTHSGSKVDKLKEAPVKIQEAKFVRPPLVPEAVINLECKVVDSLRTGDHTIFVGRILAAYINEEKELLFNLGEYKFGEIKETQTLFKP